MEGSSLNENKKWFGLNLIQFLDDLWSEKIRFEFKKCKKYFSLKKVADYVFEEKIIFACLF